MLVGDVDIQVHSFVLARSPVLGSSSKDFAAIWGAVMYCKNQHVRKHFGDLVVSILFGLCMGHGFPSDGFSRRSSSQASMSAPLKPSCSFCTPTASACMYSCTYIHI